VEAASNGIKWTFTPMVDVARDPRWGRIAEGYGEDTYLAEVMGVATVKGFQSEDLKDINAVAACAKHYIGYGATEGGRDYNTTLIPENTLRDIYLPPF
jgi:beta-glucosidase